MKLEECIIRGEVKFREVEWITISGQGCACIHVMLMYLYIHVHIHVHVARYLYTCTCVYICTCIIYVASWQRRNTHCYKEEQT